MRKNSVVRILNMRYIQCQIQLSSHTRMTPTAGMMALRLVNRKLTTAPAQARHPIEMELQANNALKPWSAASENPTTRKPPPINDSALYGCQEDVAHL